MKRRYKILIGFALVAIVAVTYRAPVIEARLNEVRRLISDLANGNLSVVASSTATGAVETAMLESGLQPSHVSKFAGKLTWFGASTSVNTAILGTFTSDFITASVSGMPTEGGYLSRADIFNNNSAVFGLSTSNASNDAEITYVIHRAAP